MLENRRGAMYARVLTFSGVNDIDAGVRFIQETAQPIVRAQRGYRGMTASADRAAGILGTLSLWETEADRDASESALGKTREEARGLLGAQLTVATMEELAVEITRPPAVGSPLMLTRISMDPARIDENLEFFKREVVPEIKASPGFRALRNMMDRQTGEGMVGTSWDDEESMRAAAAEAKTRREEAGRRGVSFGETTYREVVYIDLK
jgi:heme-degrading monooxygenase HmoA